MRLPSATDRASVYAATSRLLQYPDQELLDCLGSIEQLVRRSAGSARVPLLAFIDYLRTTALLELQAAYVETFDLRSRNSMYLTYAGAGDTRSRGMALWRFADLYRRHGYAPTTGELPDFLPALLELAAEAGPGDDEPYDFLVRHRAEIALLRASLEADGSPYAGVVRALELTLPRLAGLERDQVRRLAEEGPPEEQVGVAPDFRWLTAEPGGSPEPCGPREPGRSPASDEAGDNAVPLEAAR